MKIIETEPEETIHLNTAIKKWQKGDGCIAAYDSQHKRVYLLRRDDPSICNYQLTQINTALVSLAESVTYESLTDVWDEIRRVNLELHFFDNLSDFGTWLATATDREIGDL